MRVSKSPVSQSVEEKTVETKPPDSSKTPEPARSAPIETRDTFESAKTSWATICAGLRHGPERAAPQTNQWQDTDALVWNLPLLDHAAVREVSPGIYETILTSEFGAKTYRFSAEKNADGNLVKAEWIDEPEVPDFVWKKE